MKIRSLQISNILSFKYYENMDVCPKITFEDALNILIGENGAGKSTGLEVISFIFHKVLFLQHNTDEDRWSRRSTITASDRRSILAEAGDSRRYSGLRLQPCWGTETKPQKVRVVVELDEVDIDNLATLNNHKETLTETLARYSTIGPALPDFNDYSNQLELALTLNRDENVYNLEMTPGQPGSNTLEYLQRYNLYKELIRLFNIDHADNALPPLHESLTIIGGYRNYHTFNPNITLRDADANQQIYLIRSQEFNKSLNTPEQAEPSIFNLVRLQIAGKHFELYGSFNDEESEARANDIPFLHAINERLKLVNLACKIKLSDKRSWSYTFAFFDLARNEVIDDIQSLSAGQKAIIHLIFEAYGRGNLKGGLVIIDEPEIHLHYQFQHEYLRIIEEINSEQQCQYVLVTHSEALINSQTISAVKRFALDEERRTIVYAPMLNADQKSLVKILDNTRSTYAFFTRKVVLVEGDTDRYFFKAVLEKLHPVELQNVAILDINGKGGYAAWRDFFKEFGLKVCYIGDFDNVFTLDFSGTTLIPASDQERISKQIKQARLNRLTDTQKQSLQTKHDNLTADSDFINTPDLALWQPLLQTFLSLAGKPTDRQRTRAAKAMHSTVTNDIETKYTENVFILKEGSIEAYVNIPHARLENMIAFCRDDLGGWLASDPRAPEIKDILTKIVDS